jgi:predicted permease
VDTVLWTIGVAVLSAGGLAKSWRGLFNAPILSLVCAVVLNLALPHVALLPGLFVPDGVFLTTARALGQCATPLGLLLTGAIVADHLVDLRRPTLRVLGWALVVRFGVAPMLYLLIAKFLPCSVELKRVLVVQGTMPSAMFPVLMTRKYGGDSRIAVQIVFATTIASLAFVPLWLRIAGMFIGL